MTNDTPKVPIEELEDLADEWEEQGAEFVKMNPVGKAFRSCAKQLQDLIAEYENND